MQTHSAGDGSDRRTRPRTAVLGALAALACLLIAAPAATAATGQIGIIPTNSSPQPSGAPLNYTLNFTCSATEAEGCGEDPTITIPLDLTSSLPDTPAMDGWTYSVTSPIPGLVEGWEIVAGELVIRIDESQLNPGDSLTIQLSVTPPNGYTPNGTSWELLPSFGSSNLPEVEAQNPVPGEATASPKIAVAKNTNDGGSIYVSGNQVIYNITASCNAGLPAGSLYLTEARLVDQLPPEAVFVSATPAPTEAPDGTSPGGEVVWEFENPGTMPPFCVENPGGSFVYQVIVEIPEDTPDETVFHNEVTMFGTAIGDPETELETTAPKNITVIDVPPTSPGAFLAKAAQGPLEIPGLGFTGTYPGHWMTPIESTPGQNPGAAEGRYTVGIVYPASRAFETDLVDPVPCLDEKTGVKYSSLETELPVDGAASAPLCENPAFHPTVIRVASASLPQAIAAGWQPEVITTDGTVIPLSPSSASGTNAFYSVPVANLGDIAAVRLPPHPMLTDVAMAMDVWGYADASTVGGEILEDIAAATAYPVGESEAAGSGRHHAELYIEENQLQLAVYKSFGAYRAAGGATALNLIGGIAIPPALTLPGPIVLADLLPQDMQWVNPPGSGEVNFTLTQGSTNLGPITGTVEHIADFEGSGRELIRVSFDPADFPGQGYYRLTPPTNFIRVSVPQGARVYDNTAQIFAFDAGRNTSPACGAARNAEPSTFESEDPLDLDGDGEVEENHCSFNAELKVPAEGGPAFSLAKQVQGDLDSLPKGPPGIGKASNGGSGEYTLIWRNIGGTALENPVIYDILPYVGDTGIVEGQTSTPRGSEFGVIFDEVTELDPGVTVEYSDSTNPCRPEVLATNPGCTEDWTATPDDPSDVRALRFVASDSYEPGDSFQMKFKISLPLGEVNEVAWNSSATRAELNGTPLIPAEPPKVGITAEVDPVTPTVSTQISTSDADPGATVSDTITVGNSDDINGTINWQLVGPVEVGEATDCDGADWSGAAVLDEGTIDVEGSGEYTTESTSLAGFGCFGYVVTLEGPGYTGPVTSPAGSANEVVIVRRLPTNISTQVSSADVGPADEVTDTVTIAGSEGREGEITWRLLGPVEVGNATDCDAVDWEGAAVYDEGSLDFTGDGEYETAATALDDFGCYSYDVTVGGGEIGWDENSPAGSENEVVIVRRVTPTISTQVSSADLAPDASVTDTVTIGASEGREGEIEWQLLGPVDIGNGTSCDEVDWEEAEVFDEGELSFDGDGDYETAPTSLTGFGCYGYVVLVGGEELGSSAESPAGSENEVVIVRRVQPTVTTAISAAEIGPGGAVTDAISVGGTEGRPGEIEWSLVGPVPMAADWTCNGVSWAGARTAGQGVIATNGDGTYRTSPVALPEVGCYSFVASIGGEKLGNSAASPAGSANEVVLVRHPPGVLAIEKSADRETVEIGQTITYTLKVTNTGSGPAEGVVVTDTPSTPMRFVSAKPSQGTCGTGFPLVCQLGTLGAGGTATVEVVARPLRAGAVSNGATVDSPDPKTPGSRDREKGRAVVALRLGKKVNAKVAKPGKRLTYRITVGNPTSVAARNVKVCDRPPAGLEVIRTAPRAKLAKGSYCWRIKRIPAGGARTLKVVARVIDGASGKLVNVATVSGGQAAPARARAAVRVKRVRAARAGGVTG